MSPSRGLVAPSALLALTATALTACAAASQGTLERHDPVTVSREANARWQDTAPSPRATLPPPSGPRAAPDLGPAAPAPLAPVPLLFAEATPRSLQLRGAELGQALRLMAEMGGVNLFLDGDFSVPVDLDLPDLPLQDAFELLARTYDCEVVLAGDVAIVRRDDPARIETRVYTLNSIAASAVQPQLAPLLGDSAIVVNPARNVLMVTASQSRLSDVEALLAAVDRPDRQVLIEARILEVSRERLEELGTAIAFNDISVGDDTATFVTTLLTANQQAVGTITSESGDFDAAINALHSLTGLEVLSRPRLLALNNRESRLDIISEVPYVNATTTTQGSLTGTGTQTIETIEYKQIGLKLAVTPTVLDGGLISLAIDQEISEQTGTFEGVPIVDSRHITTGFVVRQGETILIGGLLKDRHTDETNGVPLLMDIPVLGQAFRNDTSDTQQVELILLMTPWLVDPQGGRATAVASP